NLNRDSVPVHARCTDCLCTHARAVSISTEILSPFTHDERDARTRCKGVVSISTEILSPFTRLGGNHITTHTWRFQSQPRFCPRSRFPPTAPNPSLTARLQFQSQPRFCPRSRLRPVTKSP